MSLRDALRARCVIDAEVPLTAPWCWPVAPDLAVAAEALARPPAPLVPGEVLLVGVVAETHGALFRLGAAGGPLDPAQAAQDAWKDAWDCVLAQLPLAVRADVRRADHPSFSRVALELRAQGPRGRSLDGHSYGLSFAIAHASRFLGLAAPSHFAASACVTRDGRVGAVAGVAVKARVLRDSALGVTSLLVASGQEIAFSEAIGDPRVTVYGVATVREAIDRVWPDLEARLVSAWRTDPDAAARVARDLETALSLGDPRYPRWDALARGAARLEGILREAGRPGDAHCAMFARKIAERHRGASDGPLPWPDPLPDRHDVRMRCAAQIVQSCADGPSPDASLEAAARATGLLRPRLDRGVADLVLAGAIGRALAAGGQLESAVEALIEVVEDWFAIGVPVESSRPICEIVRLAGVLARPDALAAVQPRVDWWLDPIRFDDSGWLRAELVRAHVLLGDPQRARDIADDPTWTPSGQADWVVGCRARWKANALDALGLRGDARDVRRASADPEAAALMALDQRLSDGTAGSLEPGAWPESGRDELRRAIACAPPGDPSVYVARNYRY